MPSLGGLEGGAQRDLGLAVADVAADQPVHRPRRFHVGLDQLDRLALVGRLGEREALLELALPVGVGVERVPAAAAALGVEASSSPAISCAARRARAFIVSQRVPPSFSSGGMLAAGADVARDLRELVGGDEDAVIALVFEVQVVARDVGDRARLEAGEARDAVVLVHDDVAGAQVGERAQRAAARGTRCSARALGAAAAQEAVLGEDRPARAGCDEALLQRGGREAQGGSSAACPAPSPSPSQLAFRRPRL